ncbi:MAG: hypothetical protein ABJN69_10720 [Hellea sp.]
MIKYILIAHSENSLSALRASLGDSLDKQKVEENVLSINFSDFECSSDLGLSAYNEVSTLIGSKLKSIQTESYQTSVIVDYVNPSQLNPVNASSPFDSFIASMILSFPELSWYFATIHGNRKDTFEEIYLHHSLGAFSSKNRLDNIFDASGLSGFIRDKISKSTNVQFVRRVNLAAAIDDEKGIAYKHAYAAYRFGYRANTIFTLGVFRQEFQKDVSHGYDVLLEDVSLKFGDMSRGEEIDNFEKRAKEFKSLNSKNSKIESSKLRAIITSGFADRNSKVFKDNKTHIGQKTEFGKVGDVVFKPTGGMYDLERRLKLSTYLDENAIHTNHETDLGNHGVPGKIQSICDFLIRRADTLKETAHNFSDYVLGSVWSTNALELTDLKSPSSAVEALTLKHCFELAFDCQYSGKYNIEIASRMKEIEQKTKEISMWVTPTQKHSTSLNASMRIFSNLLNIVRDNSLFDEEILILNKIRQTRLKAWFLKPVTLHESIGIPVIKRIVYVIGLPIKGLFALPAIYVNFLLSSVFFFGFALFAWCIGLAFGYQWAYKEPLSSFFSVSLPEAIITFFGSNGPVIHDDLHCSPVRVAWVNSIAICSGIFHIGIFISYLFTLVSRR